MGILFIMKADKLKESWRDDFLHKHTRCPKCNHFTLLYDKKYNSWFCNDCRIECKDVNKDGTIKFIPIEELNENELRKRAEYHRKRQKGLSPFCSMGEGVDSIMEKASVINFDFTKETMYKVEKYLYDNPDTRYLIDDLDIPNNKTFGILIENGDWKHEHHYLEDVVQKYLLSLGIKATHYTKEVGHSDSDCYSAWHYFTLNSVGEGSSLTEEILTEGHESYKYKGYVIDLDVDQFHQLKRVGRGEIVVQVLDNNKVVYECHGYDEAESWIDKHPKEMTLEQLKSIIYKYLDSVCKVGVYVGFDPDYLADKFYKKFKLKSISHTSISDIIKSYPNSSHHVDYLYWFPSEDTNIPLRRATVINDLVVWQKETMIDATIDWMVDNILDDPSNGTYAQCWDIWQKSDKDTQEKWLKAKADEIGFDKLSEWEYGFASGRQFLISYIDMSDADHTGGSFTISQSDESEFGEWDDFPGAEALDLFHNIPKVEDIQVGELTESNHKRKKKKPYDSINKNAGNVEHNIAMFNHMSNPTDSPCTNPISGPMGESIEPMSQDEFSDILKKRAVDHYRGFDILHSTWHIKHGDKEDVWDDYCFIFDGKFLPDEVYKGLDSLDKTKERIDQIIKENPKKFGELIYDREKADKCKDIVDVMSPQEVADTFDRDVKDGGTTYKPYKEGLDDKFDMFLRGI